MGTGAVGLIGRHAMFHATTAKGNDSESVTTLNQNMAGNIVPGNQLKRASVQ